MAGIKWTKEEDNFLLENYENMNKDSLLDKLNNRTWNAIKLRAEKFRIKRYNNSNRLTNLKNLLIDNNETYYWIGFIMADGHIHNNNRLKITLSIKDTDHLNKFKNFIKYEHDLSFGNNDGHDNVTINIMDMKYVKLLCEKFNIKQNKTYNECDIKSVKEKNLLLSLIVGFIDGDGSIKNQNKRKDFQLRVKCHKNWFNNLEYILYSIQRITNEKCDTEVKYTKDKRYALFSITSTSVLKKLKKEVLELNIPFMKRKWDVINENYETFYERKRKRINQYISIIKSEPYLKIKDIAKIMNLSEEAIYKYKRELKK
jgi:hypothetical protein